MPSPHGIKNGQGPLPRPMRSYRVRESRVLLNPPANLLGAWNAILSTKSIPYIVDQFAGPLSIKWMPSGWALWETKAGRYRVDPSCYLILNSEQVYSLVIDTREPRESFCPFFSVSFIADVHRVLTAKPPGLLDDPHGGSRSDATFPEHLRPADRWVLPQLRYLRDGLRQGLGSDAWLEDQFHVLGERLFLAERDVRRQIAGVPAVKAGTREELYRRLCRGRDHMHASLGEALSLAAIARAACLAPHHFHRLFRAAFGRTPHTYLVGLRIARAKTLLQETDEPVGEICRQVGFESVGSFSTLFRRETGVSPGAFRRLARDNSQDPRSGTQ